MAVTQTINGVAFPAKCFAYVPDPNMPSTWKLRMYKNPGDPTPDAGFIGGCVAALGPSGFRGSKVQIPAADKPAVIAKVRAAWKQLHPGETVPGSIA